MLAGLGLADPEHVGMPHCTLSHHLSRHSPVGHEGFRDGDHAVGVEDSKETSNLEGLEAGACSSHARGHAHTPVDGDGSSSPILKKVNRIMRDFLWHGTSEASARGCLVSGAKYVAPSSLVV